MNTLKLIYPLLILCLLFTSCSDEDLRGLDIEFPQETGISWSYDIIQYDDESQRKIGTLLSENFQIMPFQQRDEILRQRKTRRIDSLSITRDSLMFSSTYFDFISEFEVEAYVENFFRIFDTTVSERMLDTLTTNAQQSGSENFTRFRNFQPGWGLFTRFDSGTARTFTILDTETFDLDFRLRGHRLTGTVDVKVTGLFDGTENISTPFRSPIFAHKIRTIATFDFNLMKNGEEQLVTFRETMVMISWYNPTGGLVHRDRQPFTISVPTIPSRGPNMVYKGERWELTNVHGIDF